MTVPPVRVVRPRAERPLVSRLLAAATEAPGGVVVLAEEEPPLARLAELLGGSYRIGAVVPASTGPVEGTARHPGAREVGVGPASASSSIAVPSSVVVAAGLHPEVDEPAEVVAALVGAARRRGGRIVADSEWTIAGQGGATGEGGDEPADGIRLLMITGPLLSEQFRQEDRAVSLLIRTLARMAGPSRVTVMTTERVAVSQIRRWTSIGVDVVEGPESWSDSGRCDRTLYSHVILTSVAARSPVREWVERTQPHAGRVVFFPSLESREAARIAPISPAEEMDGLELLRLDIEANEAGLARWAHHIWCQWHHDVEILHGWAPDAPVCELPPAVSVKPDARMCQARSGVLLVAGEGHDVLGGHEDAALRSLGEVLPQVRRRDPSVGCTVVADRPTPMLARKCSEEGALIVSEADLPRHLDSSRVLLASHGYGSGQPAVLMAAIEAGLPVICTPWAAGDFDLDHLAGVAVCAGDADLATRTWQLLSDPVRWEAVEAEARRMAEKLYSPAGYRAALSSALAMLGIDPCEGPALWPEAATEVRARPFHNPRLPIRPEGTPSPEPLPPRVPKEERPRYQLWHRTRGPLPGVLDAIRSELDRVAYRPLISILMPVYNTDRDVLEAAVASVRGQIYGRWQLCMANDGSDRPETLEVLDGLRDDPDIAIVDRPHPGGISEATNSALAVATGEFVTFLDHDDELKPHALAQVIRWLDADPTIDVLYTDEDKLDPDGQLYDPHIKPDWSPDQLTAQNYVCHLTVARRSLVEEVGGLRKDFDGSQDYDLILRLTERSDRIAHIPEPLYSWRAVPGSAAAVADAKPYAIEAAQRAVAAALERRGYGNRVDTTSRIGFFRPRYPLPGNPKVSIVIPTRDGRPLLERCINSILQRSTYKNFEIVIIDNQSTDGSTLEYLATGPWQVIPYPHRFNYARMMNLAARSVHCDALLFLNNDTEVITPEWIEGLLEHAMRPEVGAVGGRLYFGNGVPQHEGIMTGIGGWAHNTNHYGYWARGELTRNVSAVTGACTMMRPSVFRRVGGNDERLRIAYNDVDLCLRVRQAGYQIVYTPYVELYHHESSTRGRFEHAEDGPLYGERWRVKENVDPYYSPMFEDFPPFLLRL